MYLYSQLFYGKTGVTTFLQKRFRSEITDLNKQRMQFILHYRIISHLNVMQRFDKKNMTGQSHTHLTHQMVVKC